VIPVGTRTANVDTGRIMGKKTKVYPTKRAMAEGDKRFPNLDGSVV
jgi:hypothetical protein